MKNISEIIDCFDDVLIAGITDDSRMVKEGYLFVATKGYNVDHFDYIYDAINRGCSYVICDRKIDFNIPYFIVDDINFIYRECCRKFYDINLEEFKFIGVTGTDGKTTTTTVIKNILNNFAYIGTNGIELGDKFLKTNNTTPCISELYEYLAWIKNNGSKNVVLEVSSEALLHDRVKDIKFDVVAITNITGDHLNIHKNFENYKACKLKILDLVKDDGLVVINGDDCNLKGIKCNNLTKIGFDEDNNCRIFNVKEKSNYSEFSVKLENKEFKMKTKLKGIYNIYNITMAFIISSFIESDISVLIEKIENVSFVKGRREDLFFGQDFKIILDYAHTINGIKNILESFQGENRIITVLGCAGGREREKRSIIGNLVMDLSDVSIFTMDDPRNEGVDEIIREMGGDRRDFIKINDRAEAINFAFDIASIDDIVLILGKGRDEYMAIGDERVYYSDYDVICQYFNN